MSKAKLFMGTTDGRQIPFDRWPEDLRIREFPNGM